MSVDRSALEMRAAVHAALGEPSRLAIVDALIWGDVSPSELQARLDLPSNLLAHHLKVLEQAGVVERSRSEGDHRRTYIRLVPAALGTLASQSAATAARVVFVCTHNSARSQLAVALWRRRSHVPAASAGTWPAERIHPGAFAVARRHALPLPRVRPRHVAQVLAPEDLVVTVCDTAHEELGGRGRLHWSVPDPARSGSEDAFDLAYAQLAERVGRLAPLVLPEEGSTS